MRASWLVHRRRQITSQNGKPEKDWGSHHPFQGYAPSLLRTSNYLLHQFTPTFWGQSFPLMSHWGIHSNTVQNIAPSLQNDNTVSPGSWCPSSRWWAGKCIVNLVFTMLHNKHTPYPQWLTESKALSHSLWQPDLWAVAELCSDFWEGAARFRSCQSQGRDKMAEHWPRQAHFRSNTGQSHFTRQR